MNKTVRTIALSVIGVLWLIDLVIVTVKMSALSGKWGFILMVAFFGLPFYAFMVVASFNDKGEVFSWKINLLTSFVLSVFCVGGAVLIFVAIFGLEKSTGVLTVKPATPAAPHAAVVQSSWDDSVPQVKEYLKTHANDPSSLSYIKWQLNRYSTERWKVDVDYRAKNGFGALVLCHGIFYLDNNGNVVEAYPDKTHQN